MLDTNIFYSLVLTVIDSFLFLFFLKPFVHKNTNTKILNIFLIILLSLLALTLSVLNIIPYIKVMILSFFLIVYTHFYNIGFVTRLLIVFIFYLLIIFIESILTIFLFRILSIDLTYSILATKDIFFIGLLNKLGILGAINLILPIMKPSNILLPKKHNIFLITVLLISITSMLVIFRVAIELQPNTLTNFFLFSISLTLVVINIGVFYFYISLAKYYKNAQKYEIKKALDKMNERQLSKSQAENHQTAKIWHDMKNHIRALEVMVEEQADVEYESYIYSLKEQIEKVSTRIKTGNKIADIILNKKHSEVSAYNIDFYVKAALPPRLEIEDVDFSSILFNTIDNAIEATTNLPNGQNGFIHIDLYPRGGNLYYNIENNYDEDSTSKHFFAKKDYLSPGYGLEIVQDIVSKYNGHLQYKKNNGKFILTVHMPVL